LAHVTEHLVVFGAPDGSDEARDAERWFRAGRANGETLPGWMYFDVQVEPGELESALRVQAVRLARPEFTGDLLSREIPRTLAEFEHLEESETYGTGKFAFDAFVQAALHDRDEVPIKARTKDITIEDVRLFHAAHFRPDRAILCLVGDFDAARARKAIEEVFGLIPKAQGVSERPRLQVIINGPTKS
jgi:zinc protease